MNKLMITVLLAGLILVTANSETVTVITTETYPDGAQETSIEYLEEDGSFKLDSFRQADKNHDGCLDKEEAHLLGIFNFSEFAKESPNCLNASEYKKAMHEK